MSDQDSEINFSSPALHAAKLLKEDGSLAYTGYSSGRLADLDQHESPSSSGQWTDRQCFGMCSFPQRNCIDSIKEFVASHDPMKEDSWWTDAYYSDYRKASVLRRRVSFLTGFLKDLNAEYGMKDSELRDMMKDHFKTGEQFFTDAVSDFTISG